MPRHHRSAAPLLAFVSRFAASSAANDDVVVVDLYVRERYRNARGRPCDFCDERDGCFADRMEFFPRGGCSIRGADASSVLGELEEEGALCRQYFDRASCDEGPIFNASSADDCDQVWKLNECGESSLRTTKLSGWCALSPQPVGEYEIPLVEIKMYSSGGCQAQDLSLDRWHPSSPELCTQSRAIDDCGLLTRASVNIFCDGDTLRAEKYSAPGCSGDAEILPLNGTNSECPMEATDLRGNYAINNCKSPTMHCKKLDSKSILGGNPQTGAAPADPIPDQSSATTSSNATSEGTVPASDQASLFSSSTSSDATSEGTVPANNQTSLFSSSTSSNATSEGTVPASNQTSSPSKSPATQPTPSADKDSSGGVLTIGVAAQAIIAALCAVLLA